MLDTNHLVRYGVAGYGRIGSYANAKKAGRSRSRRCWMITVWDARDLYEENPLKGKIGDIPVPRLGKHRTKKAAIESLIAFAEEASGEITGDIAGYPMVTLSSAIEPELTRQEIKEILLSL